MFQASDHTTVVTSTHLIRQYKDIQKLLQKNMIVLVTNRNSNTNVDGIMIPYSREAVEYLEDFIEDMALINDKKTIDAEVEKSLSSGKAKRYSLDEVIGS